MALRTPKRTFLRPLWALAAAMALVLAACGDDSGGGEELSEADFVAQFSEICMDVDEQISALDANTVEEGQVAAAEAQAIVEDGITQLQALQPPSDIADEVDMGIDALAQTGDVFGELANIDDEAEFVETGAQIDAARQEADQALGPLGIQCGADGSGDDGAGDDASSSE